jgi:hypothetical protein
MKIVNKNFALLVTCAHPPSLLGNHHLFMEVSARMGLNAVEVEVRLDAVRAVLRRCRLRIAMEEMPEEVTCS